MIKLTKDLIPKRPDQITKERELAFEDEGTEKDFVAAVALVDSAGSKVHIAKGSDTAGLILHELRMMNVFLQLIEV